MEDERPLTREEQEEAWDRLRIQFAGGHALSRVATTDSGRRYFGECCCGYRSTTRTTAELAQEAVLHHYRKMEAEQRRNGNRESRAPLKVISTTGGRKPA